MKRVLYLAYHFPPIGGGGVQRQLKFVRYLRDFGWESIVVTGPATTPERWTPVDATMLSEVPPEAEVYRLPEPEPPPWQGWRGRAERWLQLDPDWVRWWEAEAVRIGLEVGRDADVICASLVPYPAWRPAAMLARRLGKPWVADLQDPWAMDEMMVYPTALHRRRALGQMRHALSSAGAVVMNTCESRRRLIAAFPEWRERPVYAIPNGFDPEDFEAPVPERSDSSFRIAHAGYLHTVLGGESGWKRRVRAALGGGMPGVDILTRSHVFLVEAIERLAARAPELGAPIELHLAGITSPADYAAVRGRNFVQFRGYMSHGETLALLRSSDLLFLPMHDFPEGRRVGIVPGKTYEYLASGVPILAAVPDGDARDLLAGGEEVSLARPKDVGEMERILETRVRRFLDSGGERVRVSRRGLMDPYERRNQAAELAQVFAAVTGR